MVSKQQYAIIRAALSATEKEIISFYELQYFIQKRVPTIEEVKEHLDLWHKNLGHKYMVPYTSINYYLGREKVRSALRTRGIPFEQHTQTELTPTQVACAITVSNFADVRTIPEKLDMMGINPNQYYAWLNDPQFQGLVERLANENLNNIKPTAIGELTRKINEGDWNAIKYYLDATGTIKNPEVPHQEVLIKMIVEIIQKHVKDANTIAAIAQDMIQVMNARTIEGAVVESYTAFSPEELSRAERMLKS